MNKDRFQYPQIAFQDGYKQALEDVKKLIKDFPFSLYGDGDEFTFGQLELTAKDRAELIEQINKLEKRNGSND